MSLAHFEHIYLDVALSLIARDHGLTYNGTTKSICCGKWNLCVNKINGENALVVESYFNGNDFVIRQEVNVPYSEILDLCNKIVMDFVEY
jgi:hypothetical protein